MLAVNKYFKQPQYNWSKWLKAWFSLVTKRQIKGEIVFWA